jgi:RNA polymerase-binding transcription factor DksA
VKKSAAAKKASPARSATAGKAGASSAKKAPATANATAKADATAKTAPAKAAASAPKKAPAKSSPTTAVKKAPASAKASSTKAQPKGAAKKSQPAQAQPVKSPSTKAQPTKAPTPKAAPAKAAPKPSGPSFDSAFLQSQRALLLEERSNLVGQAERLEDEAAELMEDLDPGDVQFDDESGEGDSLVVERERDLALSAQARQTVSDIDAALLRIKDGTYGYSVVSGRPIPKERLKAIPWATELVEEKVGGLGSRR